MKRDLSFQHQQSKTNHDFTFKWLLLSISIQHDNCSILHLRQIRLWEATEGLFLQRMEGRRVGQTDSSGRYCNHFIKRWVFTFLLAKTTGFLSKMLPQVFRSHVACVEVICYLLCDVDSLDVGSIRERRVVSFSLLWQVYQRRYYLPISIFQDVHKGHLPWYLKMSVFKITI